MAKMFERPGAGAFFGVVAASLVLHGSANACSTFLLRSPDGPVFGRNVDSTTPAPGMLVTNKRGIAKRALSWGMFGPGDPAAETAEWVSRYGSVTATAIGRELPDGGMNEAGLVIEEMTLEGSKLPKRGRPSLPHMQWIQYQLDTKGSVAEVLADIDRFDLTGWDWHFLVADAGGDCASIEFIEGEAVVHRGGMAKGCVLTNDQFSKSAEHLKDFAGFGGAKPIPEDRGSLSRFVRAAARLDSYDARLERDKVGHAFATLEQVDQGQMTFRSFVHDIGKRRLYFRTPGQRSVKYVDLMRIDFSASTPVLTIGLEQQASGDLTGQMRQYTRADNRKIIAGFYDLVRREGVGPLLDEELRRAGLSQQTLLDRLAAYPETMTLSS